MTPEGIIARAIGHAIFKHDLNITDDLFIIHTQELEALCEEAEREIMDSQS